MGIETTGMTQDLVPLKQDTVLRIVLVVTTVPVFISLFLYEFCFFFLPNFYASFSVPYFPLVVE